MKFLFRFRLRTLLIAMTLLGAVGGWLAMHDVEHRREMNLIEEIVGDLKSPGITMAIVNDGVVAMVYDHSFFG